MDVIVLVRALLGAVVGGALGAAAWCTVSMTTGYELGILAWGVGLLAGGGALLFATRDETSVGTGSIAAIVALLAILAGKWVTVSLHMGQAEQEVFGMTLSDESLLIEVADAIVLEREGQGEVIEWPTEADIETATEPHEYPADIWAEAEARLRAMPDAEREERLALSQESLQTAFREGRSLIQTEIFKQSFGVLDIVFIGLAMFTAFRIGGAGAEEN